MGRGVCAMSAITAIRIRDRYARGVTIVEALVALVVLSVGMLGIASLYVSSLKAERSAQIRVQAVTLVSDMADRIRANAPARDFYGMAKYGGNPGTHDCVASAAFCSTTALAEDDLARWADSAKALPGTPTAPQATVVYTAAAKAGQPDRFQIVVAWREPGDKVDVTYQNNLEIIPGQP